MRTENKEIRTATLFSPTTSLSTDASSSSQFEMLSDETAWDTDGANPHNWLAASKYTTTILLSFFTFNTMMSSTMIAPALGQINEDLEIHSGAQTQLVLSIYVLAYAVGFFLWAPISEVYGRKRILQTANAWFCVWNTVCGFAPNEATIIVGRLFSGAGAAANLALGTGAMGEIWLPAQRGRSLAVLSTVTLLGPSLGPILGGALAEYSTSSWRWAFWSTSILNATLQLISFRFLRESHAPTILRHRLDVALRQGRAEAIPIISRTATSRVLLTSLKRPFYLLFTQSASQGLVLYSGISFGSLYIILSVLTRPFIEVYGQSLTIASLNYVSFGVGATIGAQVCGPSMDAIYKRKATKLMQAQASAVTIQDGVEEHQPKIKARAELRLYPFMPAVLLVASGLILFGWSIHFGRHWIVPNIGIAIFSAGNQASTQCINAYVIDTFSGIRPPRANTEQIAQSDAKQKLPGPDLNWSASAMASIWSVKSLGGFVFPLFAVSMVDSLGWGWTGTLLALSNFAVGVLVAILLLVRGRTLRDRGLNRIEKSIKAGKM